MLDSGDYVIVINSDKVVVTGNKAEQKKYYRHSGYPGNLKEATLSEVQTKDSRKIIIEARQRNATKEQAFGSQTRPTKGL